MTEGGGGEEAAASVGHATSDEKMLRSVQSIRWPLPLVMVGDSRGDWCAVNARVDI